MKQLISHHRERGKCSGSGRVVSGTLSLVSRVQIWIPRLRVLIAHETFKGNKPG